MRILLAGAALLVGTVAQAADLDGVCGRIDYTEITATSGTVLTGVRFHGRFAWEASRSGDEDEHPLGGTLRGSVWLTCADDDAICQGLLIAERAKTGTDQPLYFAGRFWDGDAGMPITPAQLHPEGQLGIPAPLIGVNLGSGPTNPTICPAAFALAPVVPGAAEDAGPADGGTGTDMPDEACAVGRGGGSGWWLIALLFLRRRDS